MRGGRMGMLGLVVVLLLSIMPMAGAQTSDDSSSGESVELQAFTDTGRSVFRAAIDWLAAEDITRGCNPPANTLFCPDDFVTRGQMAIFLARAFQLPATTVDYFTDDNGKVYENAANRLFEAGWTQGCGGTRYCGDSNISRGEMAAFLSRALSLPNTSTNKFIDDNNSPFQPGINKIAAAGITLGCNPPTNNRYCPGENVTRGQMAGFLRRSFSADVICGPLAGALKGDCQTLFAFYEQTNGGAWVNSAGWLRSSPCAGWLGVTCGGGRVTGLQLPDNNVAGSIAAAGSLSALTTLNLEGNVLGGAIPGSIGNLANLTLLDLSGNTFTSIPNSFQNLDSLTILDLDKNLITGSLAPLAGMAAILEIRLFENALAGAIPGSLGNLANLQVLDLSDNSLANQIPLNLGNATSLTDLDLSGNNLSGGIPSNIGNLVLLTDLDLSENSLSGPVPASIVNLVNLATDGESLSLCPNGNLTTPAAPDPVQVFVNARDPLWVNTSCTA